MPEPQHLDYHYITILYPGNITDPLVIHAVAVLPSGLYKTGVKCVLANGNARHQQENRAEGLHGFQTKASSFYETLCLKQFSLYSHKAALKM